MRIIILGKSECGKCESCKDKLRIMKLPYKYIALDDANGWRHQGGAIALASAAFAGMDLSRPPIVVIDDAAYEYSAGMRVLKTRARQ